eukprot:IDg4001t1
MTEEDTFVMGIDPDELNKDLANEIKERMRYKFSEELIRKLTGKYNFLIDYYVNRRLTMYVRHRYIFDYLAEVNYDDFANWTDQDFRKVDAALQRNLRDHLLNNG